VAGLSSGCFRSSKGIVAGFPLGSLLFPRAWRGRSKLKRPTARSKSDYAEGRTPDDVLLATDRDFVVLRISGTFYFGTAASVSAALDGIAGTPKPMSSTLGRPARSDNDQGFVQRRVRRATIVYVTGARSLMRRRLFAQKGRQRNRIVGQARLGARAGLLHRNNGWIGRASQENSRRVESCDSGYPARDATA
jgi:SulP family sulfate permease